MSHTPIARNTDLEDDILEAVMAAGFLPTDDEVPADLTWMDDYGWTGYRDIGFGKVALADWSEDGIKLTISSRNYVIEGEGRFSYSKAGLAMFTAALGVSA